MNYVNYQIEVTPENAELIQTIGALVSVGVSGGTTAPVKLEETTPVEKPAKVTKTTKAKATPKEVEQVEEVEVVITHADLRGLVKAARETHGEDFCKEVLLANGAKGDSLGRMLSSLAEDEYMAVADQLASGPQEKTSVADDDLDDEDDGLGDEDTSEVTAEAVKLAVKAYAKEVGRNEAKELMNSNGAASLSKIDDCTPKQLQAMFKVATA